METHPRPPRASTPGTPDGSNSQCSLDTWDGRPGDAPTITNTNLPQVQDGAWEGIVAVPDPLQDGSSVELVEDNGDTAWYAGPLDQRRSGAAGPAVDPAQPSVRS